MKQEIVTIFRLEVNVMVKWPTLVADKEEKGVYSKTTIYGNYTDRSKLAKVVRILLS